MEIIDIIDGLLSHDERVTQSFFYGSGPDSFRPNLHKLLYGLFRGTVQYGDAVGELYAYLLEDEGRRLRSYDPSRSSFWYWMRTVAVRFFMDRRDGVIDSCRRDPTVKEESSEHIIEAARKDRRVCAEAEASQEMTDKDEARRDITMLLLRMPNKRYAYVLQQLLLFDVEPKALARKMGVEVSNLYNIRRRAYEQLERTALKDLAYYEKH